MHVHDKSRTFQINKCTNLFLLPTLPTEQHIVNVNDSGFFSIIFQERHETAIEDCTKALELNPVYLKALLRRAELYEKTDKLDEALADYTKALEMDRTLIKARIACQVFAEK